MAPEMFPSGQSGLSSGYSFEVDWFALGVVAFELLSGGEMPFEDDFSKLRSEELPANVLSNAQVVDFLYKLVEYEPRRRLGINGAAEVRAHPWMANFDFDKLFEGVLPAPYVPPKFEFA